MICVCILTPMSNTIRYVLFISSLITSSTLLGQVHTGQHTSIVGYAGAGVAVSGIEAHGINQGGLAEITDYGFSISSQNRFGIGELLEVTLAGVKRLDEFGSVGLIISNFGIEEYTQQKYGLSYSRYLSSALTVGIQFDYLTTRIEGYGSTGNFTIEGGLQYQISKTIRVAAHVVNPLGVTSGTALSDYSIYQGGIAYLPSEKLDIYADVSKKGDYNSMHIGIGYAVIPQLRIRLGIQTNPSTFGVGLGYRINDKASFDGAVSSHEFLGNTPAISFNYVK